MKIGLVFPHQLFETHEMFDVCDKILLIEEPLFFSQYPFHKKKIILHRASMRAFLEEQSKNASNWHYINHENADSQKIINALNTFHAEQLYWIDTVDFNLEKKISRWAKALKLQTVKFDSPNFYNTEEELKEYFKKKKFFLNDFYIHERKKRNILLDSTDEPIGGRWTFDTDNRAKTPKGMQFPKPFVSSQNDFVIEATQYVQSHFENHVGHAENFMYAVTRQEAKAALQYFIQHKINDYGTYQDAIVPKEAWLFHSVLSPYLNIGLLTPQECVQAALDSNASINNVEGFIRQVLGWREFIRAVYVLKGVEERNMNFLEHNRKLPKGFWDGNTGIRPIDDCLEGLFQNAYSHHIERLMLLGNFMLLSEVQPNEVYEWFMTFYIDAYDWVMVPNVYGMSQFADGGMMCTKPYMSGSNYLFKMSHYKKGEDWEKIWDALFWNFIHRNTPFLQKNYRLSMMVALWNKMDEQKKQGHLALAQTFFNSTYDPQ
jgi:deoxyribodipyrimidine photolyase-related protein